MAAISSSQLLTIRLVCETVKKSQYCSSPLPHRVEFEALRGFRFCPSNKIIFAVKSYRLGEGVVVCLTMTTVAAFVIFLVSIPRTCVLRTVPAWQYLEERDLLFFFKAWKEKLLVAMTHLKKMFVKVLVFGERDESKGVPPSVPKFVVTKMWTNEIYIDIKESGYNL